MKTIRQGLLSPMILLLISVISCKKEAPFPGDRQNNANEPVTESFVKHTSDDFLGISMDFFYNGNNEIVSIKENGKTTILPVYDSRKRLINVRFTPGTAHLDYKYYNEDKFPYEVHIYKLNYAEIGMPDSLCATINFRYNAQGQVVQTQYYSYWFPGSGFSYNYIYNNDGNVTSIVHVPASGVPFTECEFTSYDDKPNFMGNNPWLKYMLIGSSLHPYDFMLTSKNNAVNWTWLFDPSYLTYSFTSTFEYDSFGFANKINFSVSQNNGSELGDFSRVSSSLNDEQTTQSHIQLTQPIKKILLPKKNDLTLDLLSN